jgi:hypothetical protein
VVLDEFAVVREPARAGLVLLVCQRSSPRKSGMVITAT